jgi:hypothetical protein
MEIMGIVFIGQHPAFVAFGFPPVQMNRRDPVITVI